MRTIARAIALLTSLSCPWLASAAPNDFYLSLLRRGISEYDAGRFEPASSSLRLAAFGFVDAVDQYETAYVYLALASDRLGHRDDAHDAAVHVAAADRIERRYVSLALPQPVRAAFEEVAAKLLSSADVTALKSGRPTAPATTPSTTSVPPKTASNPPRVETRTIPAPEVDPPKVTKTTTVTTTTPTPAPAPVKPEVKPEQKKPEPPKAEPKTAPVQTTTQPKPAPTQKPASTTPVTTTPAKTAPATTPQQTSVDVPSRLAAASRALTSAQLGEARRIYRELLDVRALSRDTLLRIAEGLYRARDFQGALQAFDKLGPMRSGEEPYRYYIAVANYETGNYAAAKRELDAALPYIEVTPDVTRYREKIDGAVD